MPVKCHEILGRDMQIVEVELDLKRIVKFKFKLTVGARA